MTANPEISNATARTVDHDTIVIDRRFDAPPAQVFQAFSDPAAKARWFAGADDPEAWTDVEHELDFRVGGREASSARPTSGGPAILYEARYEDIVPDARIVAAYTMTMGEQRISASLLTVEFLPAKAGTRLVLTEQLAVLDGADSVASRRHGLVELLDALDAELKGARR
jgi:uncharacterized protein YndB with AHSA1/START domain